MEFTDLYKNKFYQTLFEKNKSILDKKPKTDSTLSNKQEQYIIDCFMCLIEVLYKVESLSYYIPFIKSYPKTTLWEKTFGRMDYIRYHTETYLSGITGVFDRCILLVNQVYNLGLEERHATFENITSNKHIKTEAVKSVLIRFNKSISNIKYLRNISIHRGRYRDKELDKLSEYEFLLRSKAKFSKKQQRLLEIYVHKFGVSNYVRKRKQDVKKNNQSIYKLCDALFLTLFEKFNVLS